MKKIILISIDLLCKQFNRLRVTIYQKIGFVAYQGESYKAKNRRVREGFFDKYCTGKGLDIGFGGDPITTDSVRWDFCHGDAQYLFGVPDNEYDFVYSSHCLEHLGNPYVAMRNWWRVVKYGGYLIIFIPHRDLYEKQKNLPSRWNKDHKWFFLPENDELPDALGLKNIIDKSLSGFELIYLKVCDEGHIITDSAIHSDGEYSIEAVLKKVVK